MPRQDYNMFCPKCGNEMNESEGVWICVKGEMSFTNYFQQILLQAFRNQPPRHPTLQDVEADFITAYFCPRCGRRMTGQNKKSQPTCPGCTFKLNAQMRFQIVEKHIHRTADGKRF